MDSKARENTSLVGERDGLRAIYPLYKHSELQRNELVIRAGFEVLPYRSRECDPCIFNSSKKGILRLEPERIELINNLEKDVTRYKQAVRLLREPEEYRSGEVFGFFSNEHLHFDAGINEQLKWARSAKGKYNPLQIELFECESDYCGG